jgi:type IV pilus assembly protein PilA
MKKRQGFTLLELLIVVVILGVLALIAAPSLLNAADRAKEATVKANISAAASTVTSRFAINDNNLVAGDIATAVVNELNPENKNPIVALGAAFTTGAAAPGTVLLDATDDDTIVITGYGKTTNLLVTKTIKAPASN